MCRNGHTAELKRFSYPAAVTNRDACGDPNPIPDAHASADAYAYARAGSDASTSTNARRESDTGRNADA